VVTTDEGSISAWNQGEKWGDDQGGSMAKILY